MGIVILNDNDDYIGGCGMLIWTVGSSKQLCSLCVGQSGWGSHQGECFTGLLHYDRCVGPQHKGQGHGELVVPAVYDGKSGIDGVCVRVCVG